MYIFTLFAYFFVRIAKTDKESFLQDKVFGTHAVSYTHLTLPTIA